MKFKNEKMKMEASGNRTGKMKWTTILLIFIISIVTIFIILTVVNIVRAKNNKAPIFYYAKTVNPVDGGIIYNVFPYKITMYKNQLNDETILDISLVSKPYMNPYYNPDSPHYILPSKKIDIKKAEINYDVYVQVLKDSINKIDSGELNKKEQELKDKINQELGYRKPEEDKKDVEIKKYDIIYIGTTLNDNEIDEFKNRLKEKLDKDDFFKNKKIEFLKKDDLKNIKEKFVYIEINTNENYLEKDKLTVGINVNNGMEYSFNVEAEKGVNSVTCTFKEDFDQQERDRAFSEKYKEDLIKIMQKEKEQKEEMIKNEELKKYSKIKERLKELNSKNKICYIKGMNEYGDQEKAVKTPTNEGKTIKFKTVFCITKDYEIYTYQVQRQIAQNGAIELEEVLGKVGKISKDETQKFFTKLDGLTKYTGIGFVEKENDNTIEIKYNGKTTYVLINKLNEVLKQIGVEI